MNLKDIGAKNDMPYGWVGDNSTHRKIYNMWHGILRRCYYPEEFKGDTYYTDCTCHEDFLLLSNFVKWVEQELDIKNFVIRVMILCGL